MADLQARFNKMKKEYRCALPDCNKLLFKGEVIQGIVEVKCDCGMLNKVGSEQPKPENRPFQERMNLTRKGR